MDDIEPYEFDGPCLCLWFVSIFVLHHHMNPMNTNDKNLHYKLLVVLSSGSRTMASPFLVTLYDMYLVLNINDTPLSHLNFLLIKARYNPYNIHIRMLVRAKCVRPAEQLK